MVPLEEALNGAKRAVSLRRAGSNKVETYQVKIPRGVREGQRIRLAGQGEAGERGGKSGDLFLRVRLARHPDFTVEGNDLIHEIKIHPWQAVIGAEIKVPTPEGDVRMKIPSGHAGRTAISFTWSWSAFIHRYAWRSLRGHANPDSEKNQRSRTKDLDRPGKVAW